MNVDPTKIKHGDVMYESEYGITIEIVALEDVVLNESENYWTFKGRTGRRGVIKFRGQIKGTAYNPNLTYIKPWHNQSNVEWINPTPENKSISND